MDAFANLAKTNNTLIVPSNLSDLAGLVAELRGQGVPFRNDIVKGPGTVILIGRLVFARRKRTSRTCTAVPARSARPRARSRRFPDHGAVLVLDDADRCPVSGDRTHERPGLAVAIVDGKPAGAGRLNLEDHAR